MFARKCCELVNLVHILNLVNIKQLSRSSFCLFYGLHKQTWTQRRVQICKPCLTMFDNGEYNIWRRCLLIYLRLVASAFSAECRLKLIYS